MIETVGLSEWQRRVAANGVDGWDLRVGQAAIVIGPGAAQRRGIDLTRRPIGEDSVVEAKIHSDGNGLLVATRNADQFYRLFNRIVLDNNISVEAVAPADENVHSVYEYLIGTSGGAAS